MIKILKATFSSQDQWNINFSSLAEQLGSKIFSVLKDEENKEHTIFFYVHQRTGELQDHQTSSSFLKSFHLQSLQPISLETAIQATDEESTFGRFLREIDQKKKRKTWKYSRFHKVKEFFVK